MKKSNILMTIAIILYFVFLYFMGWLMFKQMVVLDFHLYLQDFLNHNSWIFSLIMFFMSCISLHYLFIWELYSKGINRYLIIGWGTILCLVLCGFIYAIPYMIMDELYGNGFLETSLFGQEIILHKTHFIYWWFYSNVIAMVMSFTLFPLLLIWIWYQN